MAGGSSSPTSHLPPTLVPPSQLVPHSRPTKERLILNSFFSCGSHWICIYLSLAGLAPCQLLQTPQAAGFSELGLNLQGPHAGKKEREKNKLIERRGKERGLGTEEICTFSHLQDTRQILWPAYPNQNLGCPGARSQRQLRPCLLQASQPGTEVEKLTSSLSCQGLMLPGRWSSQCPHSQTGRAQVYADSMGRANCRVILGPWGAS